MMIEFMILFQLLLVVISISYLQLVEILVDFSDALWYNDTIDMEVPYGKRRKVGIYGGYM